jgi:hypothetical protein
MPSTGPSSHASKAKNVCWRSVPFILLPTGMEPPADGFKWFGEGFDGFPARLPDDCVEYAIYIVDPKIREGERRERLRKVQAAGTDLARKLLKDYVWQREKFGLALANEHGRVQSLLVFPPTLISSLGLSRCELSSWPNQFRGLRGR